MTAGGPARATVAAKARPDAHPGASARPRTDSHDQAADTPRGQAFGQLRYPTPPLHLTVEDARRALEAAGWFAGAEVAL